MSTETNEAREARPTAYVLGEMPAEERAAFEAEMAGDEALRAEVDELREMAALLEDELTRKSGALPAAMRESIERAAAGKRPRAIEAPPAEKPPRRRRIGIALAGLALAATVPFMLTLSSKRRPAAESASTPVSIPRTELAFAPVATATAAAAPMASAPSFLPNMGEQGQSGNRHDHFEENPFVRPSEQPLSTFSIDVDTASYTLVRSYLSRGALPSPGAVRIEEMINYFGYEYAGPTDGSPFRVQVDLGVAPWAPEHRLVRVAMKGKDAKLATQDGVNLVFLVDTSGSMNAPNKLPLLKKGFQMMVDKLGPSDRVAIVAYAGSAGLVLPSTPASGKADILAALDRLEAGGSTNGGAGIDLAYKIAADNFTRGGVNRVILATDGDFNVGTTSNDALVTLIQEKAKTGVFLSVLGFGMGNLNDSLLEKIADKGNGMYAYIDDEAEAKRAMVDGMGSLITIAKDVKIQIEWNPSEVAAYRLLGYENRVMAARDFNDDRKDAGDLGAGHTVTALYEVVPLGRPIAGAPGAVLTVKLRYKEPAGTESKLLSTVLRRGDVSLDTMSRDFKFAAAVAGFGMLLRGSANKGAATFDSIATLAADNAGSDPKRRELVDLVRKAKSVKAAAGDVNPR